MEITVNGKVIQLSEAGWMEDLSEWNEDVATEIAKMEKVELTEEHWEMIREARAYYEENGTCPEPRSFCKVLKAKFGPDRATQQYIFQLFPYGLVKSTNKIAGLTRPRGCS